MKFEEAFTYDDLMLVPINSEVSSRKQPKTDTVVGVETLKIPIIAAPMNTIAGAEMAKALGSIGAGCVLHRYASVEKQSLEYIDACRGGADPWIAVGATGDFLDRAQALYDLGARKFCVDIANGHSKICLDAVRRLRSVLLDPRVSIMAGNVCTAEGATLLEEAGADVIRVGIGPGAMCSTRLVTGFGIPQLSAVEWCVNAVKHASVVADGGIRSSGDIIKALAIGADAVMIGGLLAGTDQCPGETVRDEETGQLFKYFHGMASQEGRSEWFSIEATSFVPEGISTKVPHKGDAQKIINQLNSSVQVGMSFANALSLEELYQNAKWVRVTDNGRKEGTPNRKMYKQ